MGDVFKVLKGKALSENRRHFPTHFMKLGAKSVIYYKGKKKKTQTNISQENMCNKILSKMVAIESSNI